MRRKFQVVAFVMLMALGITSGLQALHDGGTGFDDVYYSDGTFTEIVGEWYMQCDSSVSHTGYRTQWVESSEWDCQEYATIEDPCPSGLHYCDEMSTYIHG